MRLRLAYIYLLKSIATTLFHALFGNKCVLTSPAVAPNAPMALTGRKQIWFELRALDMRFYLDSFSRLESAIRSRVHELCPRRHHHTCCNHYHGRHHHTCCNNYHVCHYHHHRHKNNYHRQGHDSCTVSAMPCEFGPPPSSSTRARKRERDANRLARCNFLA